MSNSKETLTWSDLFKVLKRDKGGRWHAVDGTAFAEYISANGYRTPSRSWPHSHAKPLLTKKFAKWLVTNHPYEANKMGLTT